MKRNEWVVIIGSITTFFLLLIILFRSSDSMFDYEKSSLLKNLNSGIKTSAVRLDNNGDFYKGSIMRKEGVIQKVNIDDGSLKFTSEPLTIDELVQCNDEWFNKLPKDDYYKHLSCGSRYKLFNKFMKLSPDGNYLAVLKTINSNFGIKYSRKGYKNASIYVYDLRSGEKTEVVETYKDVVITSIAWSVDGKNIVFATDNDRKSYPLIDSTSDYKQNVGFHKVYLETGELISNLSEKLIISGYEILFFNNNKYYVLAGDSIVKIDLYKKPNYEISRKTIRYYYYAISSDYKQIAFIDISNVKIFSIEEMLFEEIDIPYSVRDRLWDYNEIGFNSNNSLIAFVAQKGNNPEGYFDGAYSLKFDNGETYSLLNIKRADNKIRPSISIAFSNNNKYIAISVRSLSENKTKIYFYDLARDYSQTTTDSYSNSIEPPIGTKSVITDYDDFLNLR